MNTNPEISNIKDSELFSTLDKLVRSETEATLLVLDYLAELERRESYLALGYSSLFDYCTRKLRYSEPDANRRIKGARCISEYPEVRGLLSRKAVSLSTIALFYPLLSKETKAQVLGAVAGKSKREVEDFVSMYRAVPVLKKRESIRPVLCRVPRGVHAELTLELQSSSSGEREKNVTHETPADETEKRFQLSFSVDRETMDLIKKAQVLMSRKTGKPVSLEEAMVAGMKEYLKAHDPEREVKRRVCKSLEIKRKLPSPGKVTSSMKSRYLQRRVKAEAVKRDGLCCAYVGPDGTRCGSSVGLQFDHVEPYARGGANSTDNIRVLCARHNRHAAEVAFGREHMDSFRRKKRAGSRGPM